MIGGDGTSNPPFDLDNRSKRSIAVDLSTDAGRLWSRSWSPAPTSS